jgi:uncharacterized repeat protein (TIGR02543 family)
MAIAGTVIIVAGLGVTYFVFLQPKVCTVTISIIGNGDVSIIPGGGYLTAIKVNSGTIITIIASPNPGYIFVGWTGDYVGNQSRVDIRVDKDMSITCWFAPE